MIWVKICGITSREDALVAVDAGADALGFVFYEKSPRRVDAETARQIGEALPPEIERVGVFAGATAEEAGIAARAAGMTAIQTYLDVQPEHDEADCAYCFEDVAKREPRLKVLPVLSMRRKQPEKPAMMWNPEMVHAFLLDSGSSALPGGTGKPFDWAEAGHAVEVIKSLGKVVVAGGLTPANVAEAITMLRPWGVDVSSGVEASPGKKDKDKVRAFVRAARENDAR